MAISKSQEIRLKSILSAISKRVQQRVDSIDSVFKFQHTGIEAWFKVEFIATLVSMGEEVVGLKNIGPDIILSKDELQIELKAATDFNPSYFRDGALKYGVPCLFLGSGENLKKIERLKAMSQIRVIGMEYPKGLYTWVIGCIVPA